ncbi:MAG: aminotransferase class III-fold pyridoxal phosphate-dependent enzyme [Terracidiphilus sp.]
MVDTGVPLVRQREVLPGAKPYQVLAAKNATLRLRGPSGHVFSFTDLTCAHGAVNFGHLNPAIDPFENRASDMVASIYPPAAGAHSQWLLKKLAVNGHSVLYRIGAAAAVATAVDLAQRTRPGKVLIIEGSCHGQEPGFGGLGAEHSFGEEALRIAPGDEFFAWDDVSCLLYEPIQTACGFVPLPLPWLRGLSRSAQDAGVTVIDDETQCGFYRFGKLSLAASEFLHPDIFLFGNSMTNGIFPLFALVCSEAIDTRSRDGEDGWQPTFQTSALGLEAAECVAQYIDSTDFESLLTPIHILLSKTGEKLAAIPRLSSFHLAGPTLSMGVRDGRAAELVLACEARGVLVSVGAGGHRVGVAPPITIAPEQLQVALRMVVQAAKAL